MMDALPGLLIVGVIGLVFFGPLVLALFRSLRPQEDPGLRMLREMQEHEEVLEYLQLHEDLSWAKRFPQPGTPAAAEYQRRMQLILRVEAREQQKRK